MIEEKHDRDDEGCAFVSIDEPMISGNAKSVGSGEVSSVRRPIGGEILWPAKSRLHQRQIAHADPTAVLGDLCVVNSEDYLFRNPFLRSRMTLRASSICRSKSGSYAVIR